MSMIYQLYVNKAYPPADPNELSFTSRKVLVTGSNTGLGYEAAIKFASLGAAHIILAVRDVTKGNAAQIAVKAAASDPNCKVEVRQLDMASFESVQNFAQQLDSEMPSGLDIAVLNAGVHQTRFVESTHGWEMTLQVNLLSTVLLALSLLPLLKRAKRDNYTPTMELVSSTRHYAAQLNEKEKSGENDLLPIFNTAESFGAGRQYSTSKLFLMYSLAALVDLAGPKDTPTVYVTSVCPGLCRSSIARGYDSAVMKVVKTFVDVISRTTEEGARVLVGATGLGLKGHGRFWLNDEIQSLAPLLEGAVGDRLQAKVWKEIEAALAEYLPSSYRS